MHIPFIIGLAIVLVVLPIGRKKKQQIKNKIELSKEKRK